MIQVNPETVLANQRVSLIGTGFSPGAVIANDTDSNKVVDPRCSFSIGGKVITGDRINDGDSVRVDNGGNWSASVDLPLSEATTAEGENGPPSYRFPRSDRWRSSQHSIPDW